MTDEREWVRRAREAAVTLEEMSKRANVVINTAWSPSGLTNIANMLSVEVAAADRREALVKELSVDLRDIMFDPNAPKWYDTGHDSCRVRALGLIDKGWRKEVAE